MPVVVVKRGSRYVILNHRGGRVLYTHPSKSAADKQARAINASLHKEGKI